MCRYVLVCCRVGVVRKGWESGMGKKGGRKEALDGAAFVGETAGWEVEISFAALGPS